MCWEITAREFWVITKMLCSGSEKRQKQGYTDAEYRYGKCLENGTAVPESKTDTAVSWYQKAAAQGQKDAAQELELRRQAQIEAERRKQAEEAERQRIAKEEAERRRRAEEEARAKKKGIDNTGECSEFRNSRDAV